MPFSPEVVGDPDLLAVDQILIDEALEDLFHGLEHDAALGGELLDVLLLVGWLRDRRSRLRLKQQKKKRQSKRGGERKNNYLEHEDVRALVEDPKHRLTLLLEGEASLLGLGVVILRVDEGRRERGEKD